MLDFSCIDPKQWQQHLCAYTQRLEALGNPKLTVLDQFYRQELPRLMQERQPLPYITRDELTKVMEWKLSRGKWRPRLLDFVKSLAEEEVKLASQTSFAAIPNLKDAVTHLSSLKGVGPATASAVLALYAPDIAPFMSDEALVAVFSSVKDYSLKHYLDFAEKLQSKAKELKTGEASKDKSKENQNLNASSLERALYAAALESKFQSAPKSSTLGKREGTFAPNADSKRISDSKNKRTKATRLKSAYAK
ncbi:hypothetical protein O6H91_17G015300 [Diphasiastrum complanatum]|uniref:Uncharacterized protein n=1 Tax=Diphasiastrum complanatum TaxID=34168 RepID=A0ACC2B4E7_DIPCM|nr:hypothetical protein O6H91_17G015300 [Diphasiastrum complanatum]